MRMTAQRHSLVIQFLFLLLRIQLLAGNLAAAQSDPFAHRRSPDRDELERQYGELARRLATEMPLVVHKMSGNPEEMFFPEYWHFEDNTAPEVIGKRSERAGAHPAIVSERLKRRDAMVNVVYSNTTLMTPAFPPFLQISNSPVSHTTFGSLWSAFSKRSYQCPTGTEACTSVNRPNQCCPSGETCMIVEESDNGDVGCCPDGQSCGDGPVASCDTDNGYTSCPNDPNGGCCVPGFTCDSIGCIGGGGDTQTIVGSESQTPLVSTTTVVATEVVTPPPGVETVVTYITTPTGTTIVGGVSVASVSVATATVVTTITQASAPVRQTSNGGGGGVLTTTGGICPTGYYRCSAYYPAYCCQNGQDCGKSACPAPTGTGVEQNSVVTIAVATGYGVLTITEGQANTVTTSPTETESGGVTVAVIPTGSALTMVSVFGGPGICATGWYNCAQGDGGGCCPSGYSCGGSCTATAGMHPGKVNKGPTINMGSSTSALPAWLLGLSMLVTGVGMVWL